MAGEIFTIEDLAVIRIRQDEALAAGSATTGVFATCY